MFRCVYDVLAAVHYCRRRHLVNLKTLMSFKYPFAPVQIAYIMDLINHDTLVPSVVQTDKFTGQINQAVNRVQISNDKTDPTIWPICQILTHYIHPKNHVWMLGILDYNRHPYIYK